MRLGRGSNVKTDRKRGKSKRGTNRLTYQWTDGVTYIVACTRIKIFRFLKNTIPFPFSTPPAGNRSCDEMGSGRFHRQQGGNGGKIAGQKFGRGHSLSAEFRVQPNSRRLIPLLPYSFEKRLELVSIGFEGRQSHVLPRAPTGKCGCRGLFEDEP